ncbi:hypothetical protein GCM10028817_41000 [Spirosoma pomorum]
MPIHELINQILSDAENSYAVSPTKDASDEYVKAFAKAVRYNLIKSVSKYSYGWSCLKGGYLA